MALRAEPAESRRLDGLAACAALSVFSFSIAPAGRLRIREAPVQDQRRDPVLRSRIAEVGKRESELLSQLESITSEEAGRQELAASASSRNS